MHLKALNVPAFPVTLFLRFSLVISLLYSPPITQSLRWVTGLVGALIQPHRASRLLCQGRGHGGYTCGHQSRAAPSPRSGRASGYVQRPGPAQKAADSGEVAAMTVLSQAFLLGRFPELDGNTELGVQWLIKAAEAGNPVAMHNLGIARAGGCLGDRRRTCQP